MKSILFLDDCPERAKAARVHLNCTHVYTAAACIELLESKPWDELYLDHDLGGEPNADPTTADVNGDTGMSVVNHLCLTGTAKRTSIVVHSLNTVAAARMVDLLKRSGYSVRRVPFTKLLEEWRS